MNTVLEKPVFKTWKTIKLGTGLKTADDFRKEIVKAGMKIDELGNDIIGKAAFTATTCETEVELILASVAELGFKEGADLKDIYVHAQELGLGLCSPEVGPQLRLHYTDQSKGEELMIAMEPIMSSYNYLFLFVVGHCDGGSYLNAVGGYPESFLEDDERFVFLRCK